MGACLPGLRGPRLQRTGCARRDPEHHAPQPHRREARHLDGGAPLSADENVWHLSNADLGTGYAASEHLSHCQVISAHTSASLACCASYGSSACSSTSSCCQPASAHQGVPAGQDWHQKLHNNTTPDDVPICEAFIAFLEAKGDNGTYWRILHDAGVLVSAPAAQHVTVSTATAPVQTAGKHLPGSAVCMAEPKQPQHASSAWQQPGDTVKLIKWTLGHDRACSKHRQGPDQPSMP